MGQKVTAKIRNIKFDKLLKWYSVCYILLSYLVLIWQSSIFETKIQSILISYSCLKILFAVILMKTFPLIVFASAKNYKENLI